MEFKVKKYVVVGRCIIVALKHLDISCFLQRVKSLAKTADIAVAALAANGEIDDFLVTSSSSTKGSRKFFGCRFRSESW